MKYYHLKKVISDLNADIVDEDGEVIDSVYDFKIEEYPDHLRIYDSNECYHIDYLEEMNSLAYQAADEFGFEYSPMTEDNIFEELNEAVKADFGKDKYLEWEDNVVMSVYF